MKSLTGVSRRFLDAMRSAALVLRAGAAPFRAAAAGRVIAVGTLLLCAAPAGLTGCASSASERGEGSGTTAGQRRFETSEDAVAALIAAAERGDVEEVRSLFGPGADELESDSRDRTQGDLMRLAAAYARGHALLVDETATVGGVAGPVRVTLAVGENLWEFPVPIVRDGAPPRWRFDTASGLRAVLEARWEANANAAIEFLLQCIAAQEEYRRLDPIGDGGYAKRFRSERGTRNGLWWPDDLAPPISPLGPMVDEAVVAAGGDVDPWGVQSYRGYRFRVLTGATAAAPSPSGFVGARTWIDQRGALTGGFAFLAWPASYGETGVESILVAMDGTVWMRDLGPETDSIVAAIALLDPAAGWEVVEIE
ncbi:MAG TPA: DUF2950 family protein [Phycisphaerales bacterium]|nr:DUF2950 family protein [Phycisphaerales bacterium]HMP37534.1 DUF2950 family protein [Phycisphaerales bacterium]